MAFPEYLAQRDLQLASYLLGLLPEEETEQLDEASIADDEIAARLCAAENDLVDGYVAGTLDQNTRDRIEAFYLKSPRRRAKVKFAGRFLTVIDRPPAASAPAAQMPVAGSDRIRRFVPRIETAPQPVRR